MSSDALNTLRFPETLKHPICSDFSVTMACAMLFEKPNHLKHLRIPVIPQFIQASEPMNREITRTDAIGAVSVMGYDADSNVVSQSDGNGNTMTYAYNALHQRVSETKPLNRGHTYSYTVFGELLTDTGPNGTITHTVDQLGRRTASEGPDGYEASWTYDLNGNLKTETNSRGITTTHQINALNQTTSSTRAGFTRTMGYDTVGNLISDTDYRGITTTHKYDAENRRTETVRAGERQISTTYNQAGLPVIIKDANGNNTVHEYNNRYHKTRTIQPENLITVFTPDAYGDVTNQNNPGPGDIIRTFDQRRRLITETNGTSETTTYEYDLNNNRTAVIKPGGQRWEYDYDEANRLVAVKNIPESITTSYTYDTADNLITITDAEQKVTTFTYDNRNRKRSKAYPDGTSTTSYTYDENSNLKTVDYPNGVNVTHNYDDLDRKVNDSYSGSLGTATIDYTLDGNGNIEQKDLNLNGSTYASSMAYDDLDRVSSKTDWYGNNSQYTYDANGNRKTYRDYELGVLEYTFDGVNRLTRISKTGLGAQNYSYNSAGLRSLVDYANGSQVTYSYDSANRTDIIENKQSGVTVSSHDYDYDANGNRIQLTESNIDAAQITTYQYDDADRLIQTNYPSYISILTLDKVGNREQEIIDDPINGMNTITYTYNNRDQLTSQTDTNGENITYSYDAAGNQTEINNNGTITTLTYSPRQRVASITQGANPTINYLYDADGLRVQKETDGQTTRYIYDEQAMIAETNTIGNTIARYYYSDEAVFAEARNGQHAYYLQDALNTTVAMTTADGAVQVRYNYDVWGQRNNQTGSSDSPFGFTGYQLDETGLYYAQQRYYNPTTARFNREDPLAGNPQTPPSLHRYLYANANPTVYIDPDGRMSIEEHSFLGSLRSFLGMSIPDDQDNSGRKAEEIAIRMAMEKQRIAEEGVPKTVNTRQENFNIFDMMNSIEKSKNQRLLRVAESSTNEMFLEMDISKAEVLKRAHLSNCVYNPKCDAIDKNIGNITRLRGNDLDDFRVDEDELIGRFSGFKSGIFKDHNTNEIIFAFAGTDGILGDMYNNIAQGAGISSYQYDLARELAVRAAAGAKRQGMKISFTGHSLGGGLASFASLVTGEQGTTFNAAGLNILTAIKGLRAEGLFDEQGKVIGDRADFESYINAFYVQGEALSRGQDLIPLILPDAVGRRVELQRGSTNWSLGQHGSVNVCRALGSVCDYSGVQ